ncbi:MAG: radical SAM protein [Planctomycetota bacterium]
MFLPDADALATTPAHLVEILGHLQTRLPSITRITSYSRARTIASKKERDLMAIKDAGLTRLHVGLESGSDQVLKAVAKGTTKQQQIAAGLKAKAAGLELSEYVMPGLGGKHLSEIHAKETADALNKIDPDFIRFRTLAIPKRVPLSAEYEAGRFEKCTDVMVAEELLMMIERLEGIRSVITSDHIVNLFADLEGRLPGDKGRMVAMLRAFLDMDPKQQRLYQVGRRLGIVSNISDVEDSQNVSAIEKVCRQLEISLSNVDDVVDSVTARYV